VVDCHGFEGGPGDFCSTPRPEAGEACALPTFFTRGPYIGPTLLTKGGHFASLSEEEGGGGSPPPRIILVNSHRVKVQDDSPAEKILKSQVGIGTTNPYSQSPPGGGASGKGFCQTNIFR